MHCDEAQEAVSADAIARSAADLDARIDGLNVLAHERTVHVAEPAAPVVVADALAGLVVAPGVVARARTRLATDVDSSAPPQRRALSAAPVDAQQRLLPRQALPVVDRLLEEKKVADRHDKRRHSATATTTPFAV